MAFNHEAEYARTLAHCVTLAKVPGWREYVWDKVQKLAQESPLEYGNLPADLAAEVKRRKAQDCEK